MRAFGAAASTFVQLYASPRALLAAAAKTGRLIWKAGPSGLRTAVTRKLAYPTLPVDMLLADSGMRLSFEERWVIQGAGLSRLHAVSIIILTRGNHALLGPCLASLARSLRDDARVEIVIVNNGRHIAPPDAYPLPVRVLQETRRFNWAAYNNHAGEHTTGKFLLFLNDDIEALHGGWLDAMLAEAIRPRIGAVAPKLLYPTGAIQHCGIAVHPDGSCEHVHKFRPRDYPGEKGECLRPRQVTAVTGACFLTGRETFERLGGFDEHFSVNYNDVDYCLRLGETGKRVVVTPYAELIHQETTTRSLRVPRRETRLFKGKWGGQQRWPAPSDAARS